MKKQYFYFYWSNILLYVSVLLLKYLICVLCPPLLILPSDDEENSIGICLESLQGKDDYKNYLFVMINYNVMRFSINNEKLHLDYIH